MSTILTLPNVTHDIYGNEIAYEGNTNLKPCKCQLEYTKEHVEVLMTCKRDWKSFAQSFYHITSLTDGVIKVKTRYYQDNIINNFINNRFNIILSSRQSGKSTSYEIFCLWYILFNQSKTVAILANKLETAVGILSKIKMAYELLPKHLQQGIKKWNEKSIELENGCKIIASATSSSAIRSKSCNVLILDEMAFIHHKTWNKFFNSVYPTISSAHDSKIIMVSTPNGLNQFYKFWNDATHGENEFVPYRVDWWEVPGRDEKWKQETIANTSERDFACEYGNDFLGSSLTLIDSAIINTLSSCKPIDTELDIDPNYKAFVRLYEEVKEGHIYSLSLDSSEMIEDSVGDSISIQVLDITTIPFVQVASVHIREGITYFEVPEIAVAVGTYFNNATMFIEANSTGLEIANFIIREFEYENVFFGNKNGALPGIKTTKKTKRLGCSTLRKLVEGQHLILKDHETIAQLSTFVKKRDSYAADAGYLDDAVMSLLVGLYFLSDGNYLENVSTITDFIKTKLIKNKEAAKESDHTFVILPEDVDEQRQVISEEWKWLYE